MKVELKTHQKSAVDKLANGKILYGGVGVGKSITALAYYYEKVCEGDLANIPSMWEPTNLYIITTAKKRDEKDWQSDMLKLGLGTHEDSLDPVSITVDSWNNLHKYKEVKNAFFIFDEQRLVGSGAWTKAFVKIAKVNQWILLSATPGDTWLDYIPVFVANGFYKNRTEFKRRHVVYNTFSKFPKVDRYIETGTLVRHRNNVLVHMPYERHTVRHCKDVVVDYDKHLFEKVKDKRWHVYEQRPLRDVAEMFSVMRKVVNSHASRLEMVQTLLSTHQRVIVFYNFDYELEILRSLGGPTGCDEATKNSLSEKKDCLEQFSEGIVTAQSRHSVGMDQIQNQTHLGPTADAEAVRHIDTTSPIALAEWNGHKHEPIPKTDRWVYLVQYAAGAEGWNCVETDAIVFYSQTYSYKHFHQAHGRIDRLNTPYTDLYYYNLVSTSFIDGAIQKALKAKKSFNEASIGLKVA